MKHYASPDFWSHYHSLPVAIQNLADKNYILLKADPRHSSLRLKKVGDYWSVRIGIGYRALGTEHKGGILWFWIGPHADYDKLTR